MKSSRNLPSNIRSTMDLPDQLRNAILGVPIPADMNFDVKYAEEKGILSVEQALHAAFHCWFKANYTVGSQALGDWAEFSFGPGDSEEVMHNAVFDCISGVETRLRSAMAGADYRDPIQKTVDHALGKFKEEFGFNPSTDFLNKMFEDGPN